MSGATQGVSRDPRGALVVGLVFIVIGVASLIGSVYPTSGVLLVPTIGLGMLAMFVATRAYGWLVAGGIVTGLGVGIAVAQIGGLADDGGVVVIGLGLGFISIWVLGILFRVPERFPWPLIPGGILTTLGVSLVLRDTFMTTVELWPIILIAIGVLVMTGALRRHDRLQGE